MNRKNYLQTGGVHLGHNIKRLREILGVKQEALATKLSVTQQSISNLERKAQIEDEILDKVASILNIKANVIKYFSEELVFNAINNMFKE